MRTSFHPQTDGQSEETIQVLEDMLQACVLDHKGSWEENLPLMEFPTTTVIGRVYRWRPMRLSMGGHADHRYVGQRWERAPSLV